MGNSTDDEATVSAVRSVLRGIARRSSAPVWNRLWPRVEDIAVRVADQRTAAVASEVQTEVARVAEDVRRELAELRNEFAGMQPLAERMVWADSVMTRLGPHVAAVDERVAVLERARSDEQTTDPAVREGDPAEVRTLVDEVRAEHARIRARLGVISKYEERIARLERLISTDRREAGEDAT
jgi:hypothetical protein